MSSSLHVPDYSSLSSDSLPSVKPVIYQYADNGAYQYMGKDTWRNIEYDSAFLEKHFFSRVRLDPIPDGAVAILKRENESTKNRYYYCQGRWLQLKRVISADGSSKIQAFDPNVQNELLKLVHSELYPPISWTTNDSRYKFCAVAPKDEVEMARILGKSVSSSSITYKWYDLQRKQFIDNPYFTHFLDSAKLLKCYSGHQFMIDGKAFEYNSKRFGFPIFLEIGKQMDESTLQFYSFFNYPPLVIGNTSLKIF